MTINEWKKVFVHPFFTNKEVCVDNGATHGRQAHNKEEVCILDTLHSLAWLDLILNTLSLSLSSSFSLPRLFSAYLSVFPSLSLYVCLYLPLSDSLSLSLYLCLSLSFFLSTSLCRSLSLHLSYYLCISTFLCLSLSLPLFASVCLSLCLSLLLSASLSLNLQSSLWPLLYCLKSNWESLKEPPDGEHAPTCPENRPLL